MSAHPRKPDMNEANEREIDDFYPALREIFDLKMALKHGDMKKLIDESFQKYLGINLENAERFDARDIIDRIAGDGINRSAKLMIASHLYKEMADLYVYVKEMGRATDLFHQSLLIFLEVYHEDPQFDFYRHIAILPELTNRIPQSLISEEMGEVVEKILDSVD